MTRLRYPLSTLQVVHCCTRMQDSLPGRWLAFAGRASNPLDSNEKFQSATSDLLLSQAYPGATECKIWVLLSPRCGIICNQSAGEELCKTV